MVDEDGGAHDPGIGLAGHRVAPLLGAIGGRLLLRLADEEHPLVALEIGQVGLGDVVLALTLLEGDQVDTVLGDEVLDVGHEASGHRVHECRRSERRSPVALEESHHAGLVLELGHVEVQVHAIDALDLQGHVIVEHFGHRTGYGHFRAPVDMALTGNNRFGRFKARPHGPAPRLGRSPHHSQLGTRGAPGEVDQPPPTIDTVSVSRTSSRRAGAKPR